MVCSTLCTPFYKIATIKLSLSDKTNLCLKLYVYKTSSSFTIQSHKWPGHKLTVFAF